MGQLPLALALADHATFATFVSGGNDAVVRHVASVAQQGGDTLWLFGQESCGKTHLLQAACRAASSAGRRAMYVRLPDAVPEMLVGLDVVELLALDDVDRVAGDPGWEESLFVIVNEFLARRTGLLLAAEVSAAACRFGLPDLHSRAIGAVNYRLKPLADDDRSLALRVHAEARGLTLEPAAAEYLLKRVGRSMATLTEWLDHLDRASLAEQRALTIPFIRERLALGADAAG